MISMNMKILMKILLVFLCISCSNSNTEKTEYVTNLLEAKVSRITERLQVMIDEESIYSENRKLITDGVVGYIGKQIIYDENGKAIFIYSGGSEGFISYSLHPKKWYLSFEGSEYNYMCIININKNYIIDIANPKPERIKNSENIDLVADIIRDFVIIPKDKIILSKDDYKMLQKAKNGYNMNGRDYILYRYK